MPTMNTVVVKLNSDMDLFMAIRFLIDTELIGGAGNLRANYVSPDTRLHGNTAQINVSSNMQIPLRFVKGGEGNEVDELWLSYDIPPEVHHGS